MDWEKTVNEYRAKVKAETTPVQLFEIFQAMIQPLGDLHTGVVARDIKRSTAAFWRAGTNRLVKGKWGDFIYHGWKALLEATDQTYLRHAPRTFCNRRIHYGHVDERIGYLRIMSFDGYSGEEDLRALEAALDVIFSDRQLRALVIDTRLSFGGSDELALAFARRLTDKPYEAFSVEARAGQRWTKGVPIIIQPSSRAGFYGPVVQLTGPLTLSASETLVEALMGRSPHVTRIGESTQGVFCDVLDRHLPNGWLVGLPNAVYRMKDGRTFDAVGVPPDIEIPVFADEDVARGRDPAMAKAIEILGRSF